MMHHDGDDDDDDDDAADSDDEDDVDDDDVGDEAAVGRPCTSMCFLAKKNIIKILCAFNVFSM